MTPDPLATPERIALAGDWHGDLNYAQRAVGHAEERGADVLLHLGDTGYDWRERFIRELDRTLGEVGLPMLFVEGNHDDHVWLASQPLRDNGLRQLTEWIWHIPRGFCWEWSDRRFMGLGGAHSVDRPYRIKKGHLWQWQERITLEEAAYARGQGLVDVLLSHDCPDGVDIPGLEPGEFDWIEIQQAQEHRELLRTVVDAVQPGTIWHGHYHQRYYRLTKFGYGRRVNVYGLAANSGPLDDNVQVINLSDIPKRKTPIVQRKDET